MAFSGTRIFLELRVGETHTVEVLIHLRRKDLDWFRSSEGNHRQQIFQLLSRKILPKECSEEIEAAYLQPSRKNAPVIIGESNNKKKLGTRRKRTKPKEAAPKEDVSKTTDARKRQDRHVFGETIQVVYHAEDIRQNEGSLLVYKNDKNTKKQQTSFRQLPKLSKRIELWCYPLDADNPTEPTEGGGFRRPDLIPITSLFRSPLKQG